MATRIRLDSISKAAQSEVQEKLHLQPKKDFFQTQGQWHGSESKDDEAIRFFALERVPEVDRFKKNELVDERVNEGKEENRVIDYIHLPFAFSAYLTGKYANNEKKYAQAKLLFGPDHYTAAIDKVLVNILPIELVKIIAGYVAPDLRPEQIGEVNLAQQHIRTYNTTTLKLPPGSGKTVEAAYLACQLNLITLIYLHRVVLVEQWVNTFKEFTNAQIWVTGTPIPKFCNVIITMAGALDDYVNLPQKFLDRVGLVIIDEAHAVCTRSHAPRLLRLHPRKLIACTATPKRPDEMEVMLHYLVGMHQVERKLSVDVTVYKCNTGIKAERIPNKTPGRKGVDWAALIRSLYNNDLRNYYILRLVKHRPTAKIIILTWQKAHVETVYKLLRDAGESVDTLYGNKKKYINSRILVGSLGKISTGFDPSSILGKLFDRHFNVGIMCTTVKSEGMREQALGRCFRDMAPELFQLVDDDPTIARHWTGTKGYLRSIEADIKDIDLWKLFPVKMDEKGNALVPKIIEKPFVSLEVKQSEEKKEKREKAEKKPRKALNLVKRIKNEEKEN